MKVSGKSYCYLSTNDPEASARSGRLGLTAVTNDGRREVFLRAPEGREDGYISVINDIGDYDAGKIKEWLESGSVGSPGYDSLVSAAFFDSSGLSCTGDYFGINTHYWYMDDKTFCCSDNVFLVAGIAGSELSRESLWEYLFFLSPIKERTWFEGISRLRPGQSISYSAGEHKLSITEPHDLFGILNDGGGMDMIDAVNVFFEGAKRTLEGRRAAVSISAGSDSNTVLGCVRGTGIPFRGYSFGTPFMVETRHISENANRIGFDWEMIDMTAFESSWRDRFRRTLLLTNGLLNPYRTHYDEFFGAIRPDEPVFEGILGSELVKGEYAIGATLAKAHLEAVTSGDPIDRIVEREFSGLTASFRRDMADYIADTHGGWLRDVNTEEGANDFRSFVLEFAPGRILAGMILQGASGHDMYEPFASPMILGAIYRRGLGLVRDIGIRRDSRGYVRVIEAEALIVRHMDEDIYNNVLDRGVSYREILTLPHWRLKLMYRFRNRMRRIRSRRYRFGQVDNRSVEQDTRRYAESLSGRHEFTDALIGGGRHYKESATLGMILDVLGR